MEHINCVVDTQPMANELKSVSNHVSGTTTAVIAMQAAVIKADQDAADQVCHDVNRGFHALMSSQLSQKIAKLQSDVDSHLMRLNQQAKQLMNIKKQMERDYQRTAMRYCKTFNTINKELRQRVQELDQPVFKFATTEVEMTRNRMNALTATIPVVQSESIIESQKILTSNVKYHGMKVLETSRDFVADMEEQRELTKRILLDNRKAETSAIYMPVIVSEGNFAQGSSSNVYCSNELLSAQNVSNIKGEIIQNYTSFEWQDTEKDALVENEVVRLMSDSPISDRVKKTMNALMDAAEQYKSL
jgi:hypothetical protein